MWEDNRGLTFSLEEALLWIADFMVLKLKHLNDGLFLTKMEFFALQDVN